MGVWLWFPSGNTEIVVLVVGLLQKINDQGFIVNGSGSNKQHYKLCDFDIDIESSQCVVIFKETKTKMLEVDEKELKIWRCLEHEVKNGN